LHALGHIYGKRPSEILGVETEWGAYQIDVVTLVRGIHFENNPRSKAASGWSEDDFKSPRGKAIKKVKVKKDGTW
jgi:hypothetical protein